MNNKPVAWIWSEDGYDIGVCLEQDKQMGKEFEQYTIPLYTHPVKEEDEQNWKEMYWQMHELNHKHWSELKAHPVKELTDEERLDFTKAYFNIHPDAHLSEQFKIKLYELEEFAKAILRKAREK